MRYFIARPLDARPFMYWQSIAESIEELAEVGEYTNPLVVAEDLKPPFIFGVCPLKIVGGELVDRDAAEMAIHEADFNTRTLIETITPKIADINKSTFVYDGVVFPMDEVSRLHYLAIGNLPIVDTTCLTSAGVAYELADTTVLLFLAEYYKKLQLVTKPK